MPSGLRDARSGLDAAGPVTLTPAAVRAEWYIASGCSGLFAVCQSSEMYALDEDERLELAEHVATKVAVRC